MARAARARVIVSPDSYHTVSDSESDNYTPDSPPPPAKKRKISINRSASTKKGKASLDKEIDDIVDIEDVGCFVRRPHTRGYHHTRDVAARAQDLLDWFEGVRDKRGMPWRKRYDYALSIEEKGQRAYEIWVSEVMLQQTQVTTVIDYWRRWMERWPTIADLAKADIEEVNAAWRGLGYYRRARSLLAGAQTVMKNPKLNGRLPRDPGDMEKDIDGVGRYTAGAISSMAYGIRAPIIDGNIHRLFTRLLGLHASQVAPSTIKFLWSAAEELVEALPEVKGVAGDWNQALMELGSQVCKPVSPDCGGCPLQQSCKAFSELSAPPPPPIPSSTVKECDLCAPIPSEKDMEVIPSVTVYPMKKEKKVSREEQEVVCVVEWDDGVERKWVFSKRPEKGLLAGLFEPPTTPVAASATPEDRYTTSLATLGGILNLTENTISEMIQSKRHIGAIPHIFSHINMTYHILHLILGPAKVQEIPVAQDGAIWLDASAVEGANVGTGVKKVWAEVYGAWGSFDVEMSSKSTKSAKAKGIKSSTKVTKTKTEVTQVTKLKPPKSAKAVVKAETTLSTTVSSTLQSSTHRNDAQVPSGGNGNPGEAEIVTKSVAAEKGKVRKTVMMPMMPKRSVDA